MKTANDIESQGLVSGQKKFISDADNTGKKHTTILGCIFVALFIGIMVFGATYNHNHEVPAQKLFAEFLVSPPPSVAFPTIPTPELLVYANDISAPSGTIKVIPNAGSSRTDMTTGLRVSTWPIWFSKDDWPVLNKPEPYLFTRSELWLLIEGKASVSVAGSTAAPIAIQAGDFAVFPKGLNTTWMIIEPVKLSYYRI